MKKFYALVLAFALFTSSFASYSSYPAINPGKKASEFFIPLGKSGARISLADLAVIKPRELEKITGQNMNFAQKVGFKLAQGKLRQSINADGTINSKKLEKVMKKVDGEGGGFHIGGFALGFLIGLIGVLIAYLIKDEKKATRVKWAWIGFAAGLVIYLLLLLA